MNDRRPTRSVPVDPIRADDEPHRLALANGRRIAWSDLGDSTGTPAIYCHGFPSSRREADLLNLPARAQGVRILSPDRPGYGDSDPAPQRRLTDWASDCAALADRVGIPRFRLIGVSGGAPYAIACAERLAGRVVSCSLVCPLGPLYLEPLFHRMSWLARANFRLARRAPGLAESLLGGPLPGLIADIPAAIETIRRRGCNPADREALRDARSRTILNASIRDAMRGGASGALQDLQLYTHPWGVDLAAIEAPIDIWHGDSDRIVPLAHGRWYAEHIAGARLHILPGEGHYSLPLRHSAEILGALIARGA